jgi:hypothetical protein
MVFYNFFVVFVVKKQKFITINSDLSTISEHLGLWKKVYLIS